MQVNPYLLFNGNCEEAFKFYEQTLGGKIDTVTPHAGTPAEKHVPPEWQNKVLHAQMKVGDYVLMGSDAPPAHYKKPEGFSVSISLKDPAQGERIFRALEENGTVTMPFQKTFWAERFGMVVDRFGIPWIINCDQAA